MTSPPTAQEPEAPRRRLPWLLFAALAVAFLLTAGAAVWLRGGAVPPLLAPSPVATVPSPGGGSAATSSPTNSTQSTALAVTGVFVEPGDGRAPLLDEIEAARQSIDLEVYIVTDEIILEALEDARRRGVDVRVILEEHPFGGGGGQDAIFDRLEDAGIAVRWGNPVFRFTHIKAMVVDDTVAIIMNQNLTASAFTANREFGVVTTEPDAVQTAAALFDADWSSGVEPDPGPLVVSPSNARDELLTLVREAETSLDLYAEVLRDPELLAALSEASRRGVRVRVLVSPSPEFTAEQSTLAAAGVEIRLASSLYIHAKLIVADGERAFIGSQNLSATSLDQNRELGIILDDPVNLARLSRTFTVDFRSATPQEAP
jgi:cardiolipin synthase A/B